MELSAKRGCCDGNDEDLGFRWRVGSAVGTATGGSAVREAMAVRLVRFGGGVVSPILKVLVFLPSISNQNQSSHIRPSVCVNDRSRKFSYQHPPGPSRRSNTLITSNTPSFISASTVIAPEGPAPMTATRLAGMIRSALRAKVSQLHALG